MKKGTLKWIIIIAAIAVVGVWMMNGYNAMVEQQEQVEKAWGDVNDSYQHRMDMVPQLVGVAEGAVKGEKATFTAVMEARAKATQITIDPTNMTEEDLLKYQKAQGELGMALNRLMAVAENYPDLKFNQNFVTLQSQLEGIGNRISVARLTFNSAAQIYNTLIRRFPNNIVASLFGFHKRPYFEAEDGAEKAPKVEFNF